MAPETGEDLTEHEVSRRFSYRVMSQTDRRMHVGFPGMLSYLLWKPTVYCRHEFVSLPVISTPLAWHLSVHEKIPSE